MAAPIAPVPHDDTDVTIDAGDVAYLDALAQAARGLEHDENFPMAAGLLPRRPRTALLALYRFARLVDDVGDRATGNRSRLLELLELDVRAATAGTARVGAVRALAPHLASRTIPPAPLLDLIEANRRDQTVTSYATFDDLLGYCRFSAAPVGRAVLHLAEAATPENIAASDRVCAALQVLEHCQDVSEDARAGRIYLPADDLAAAGICPGELRDPVTSPALRSVIGLQVRRARDLLRDGVPLVARLHGWARLAVAGYVAGGLATADALDRAGGEVLARPVTPRRSRIAGRAAALLATAARGEPPPPDVADAYRECERITGEQARNFAWGIRLLPPAKRRALSAVYAFARRVDDIGDGTLPVERKVALLAEAREAIGCPGEHAEDPVLLALDDAAHRFPVPLAAFGELVDGCEMDVTGRRYDTIDELVGYCRCVAGSIGRLSLGVFGSDGTPGAPALADALGVALQLTNILRDVREDLLSGRVYLPAEDLERFGCELRTLPDGRLDPQEGALAALVRFEAGRAEEWYDRGLRLLPLLDRRSAACCAAMAGIYRELLTRIATDPQQMMRGRMSLSTGDKARIAARSLAGRRG